MFKVFKSTGIEGSYSISSNPAFINDQCWSVYPAKHRTTKNPCSVWEFNKKEWENRLLDTGLINKTNKKLILSDMYDSLKKFVQSQSKLKHPNFLTVIEPIEEHKSRILFVTEYVNTDLKNIDRQLLDEITVAKGLLQVANGLKFLHQNVQTVHLNINPSSIVVTQNFDWKIVGMNFMEPLTNGVIEKYVDPLDSRLPSFQSIDFRFSSPNLISKHKADFIDDLFSLAALIFYLFQGELVLKCPHSSSTSDYERQVMKLNQLLGNITNSKHAFFNKVPEYYYPVLVKMFCETQESNTDVIQLKETLTIDHFINSEIFNNELIKILNVFDEFPTLSINEKNEFLSDLTDKIDRFPKNLLINKFIPLLTSLVDVTPYKKTKPIPEEEQLIVGACENLIILSKQLSQLSFSDKVFPSLQNLLASLDFEGYKILIIKNLQNLQSCITSTTDSKNNETFQKFLLELFQKSMAAQNSIVIQELILSNLKIIIEFQQYTTITGTILPTITNIYSTTTSLKIKILSINCFILMIKNMGSKNLNDYVIVDKILPLIQATSQSNYQNSKFLTNAIDLYHNIFVKISKNNSKLIQVNGQDLEVFDLILSIGFEIWRITKHAETKADLNNALKIWGYIQIYMTNDAKSRLHDNTDTTSDNADTSITNTIKRNDINIPENASTPVSERINYESHKPAIPAKVPTLAEMQSNPSISVMKPSKGRSIPATVMQPKPKVTTINLHKTTTAQKLAFGQTAASPVPASRSSATELEPEPATSNTSINWDTVSASTTPRASTAGSYAVMQPVKAKQTVSTAVMQPMKSKFAAVKSQQPEEEDDNEENAWGEFETGSQTKPSTDNGDAGWGFDSLI